MLKKFSYWTTRLNWIGCFLASTGILAMAGLVFTGVIMRRIFNAPIIFADEIGGYLLVIVTLLGLGYTLSENGHIQVKIFLQKTSPKALNALNIIWCFIGLSYSIILLITSAQLVWESYHLEAFSTTTQIPLFPFQLFVPISFLLFLPQLVLRLVESITSMVNNGKIESAIL